jgi:8-oxo-dGTP pyrophosphatase MutT (NUDIX family)
MRARTHTHTQMNIVVAVLLDEFISTVAREKSAEARAQREVEEEANKDGDKIKIKGPLDAVLETLVTFTTHEVQPTNVQSLLITF